MLFMRKENICLITRGVDSVGRAIAKIEQEQSAVRRQTGQFTANPVKQYSYLAAGIPNDKTLANDGWFYPTPECETMFTNYALGNMYQGGEIRSCFDLHGLSTDKGRVMHMIASVEQDKEGSVTLTCSKAVKTMTVDPDLQNAATKLAEEGMTKPDDLTLKIAALDAQTKREQAIANYPGGKAALFKECSLRDVMHNQKLYESYDDPEAARARGKQLLKELDELYEEEMNGPKGAMDRDFARAVAEIRQSGATEQTI